MTFSRIEIEMEVRKTLILGYREKLECFIIASLTDYYLP
jgi:hypothetical protein